MFFEKHSEVAGILCDIYVIYIFVCAQNPLIFLTNAGRWQSDEPPTVYVFINCSTRELSVIEKYVVWCLAF